MYRVLCDDTSIFDPRDEELVLIDPVLDLEANTSGSFVFVIAPNHPHYDLPEKLTSVITVYQDDTEIFRGRIIGENTDFYNRKHITCEGDLAMLVDSIQRPAEYHDMTVRGYLEALITSHNAQVESSKHFTVGIVTVTDSNDSLYRFTNYNTTLQEIKEDLLDDLGGYLRVRYENDTRYLDYIADYNSVNSQVIEFGENLLDFTKNYDLTDFATAIIPLGAKAAVSDIAALEERINIKLVNNNIDYLYSDSAVNQYGWIYKTVTWDEVTTPRALLNKGRKYLSDYQFDNMIIEATAIDLHYSDDEIQMFQLGDSVHVVSSPHGLDRYFPLSKLTIYLTQPSNNTVTLGNLNSVRTITDVTNSQTSAINKIGEDTSAATILAEAQQNATDLINSATHGYVVTTGTEQLIMDTDDINTASKLWRWNLNGLGYSSNGYEGPYTTAITMNGQIVGERIVADSITVDKLDTNYINGVNLSINTAQETAQANAITYTDNTLISYYDKEEVNSLIQQTRDSITLSVNGTTQEYVDNKLQSYVTSASLQVSLNGINTTVSKKVDKTSIISQINQSAESVTISASKINLRGAVDADSIQSGAITTNKLHLTGLINVYSSASASSPSAYFGYGTGSDGTNTTYGAMLKGTGSAYVFVSNAGARMTNGTVSFYVGATSSVSTHKLQINQGGLYVTKGGITVAEGGASITGAVSASSTVSGANLVSSNSTTTYSIISLSNSCLFFKIKGGWHTYFDTNGIYPYTDNAKALGYSGRRWSAIYCATSTISTSDRSLKHDIEPLKDAYKIFFKKLEPVSYVFNDGSRKHTGFIAQDVEQALIDSGLTAMDFGGFVKSGYDSTEPETDETIYSLRYEEFIALNTVMIQDLIKRVEALERK